jgi:hemerythrin superfamily protein
VPNGIDLIIADHRKVDELFAELEATGSAGCAGLVMEALTQHDEAEQHALYPLIGQLLGHEMVDEALLAHSRVKMLMEAARASEGPQLALVMDELRTAVQAHVADEESRLLPALAESATPVQLDELGARIMQVKQRVG